MTRVPPPLALPSPTPSRLASQLEAVRGDVRKYSFDLPRVAHRVLRVLSVGSKSSDIIERRIGPKALNREKEECLEGLTRWLTRRGIAITDPTTMESTSARLKSSVIEKLQTLSAANDLTVGWVIALSLEADLPLKQEWERP